MKFLEALFDEGGSSITKLQDDYLKLRHEEQEQKCGRVMPANISNDGTESGDEASTAREQFEHDHPDVREWFNGLGWVQ
jgi:hypothetical protein